MKRKVKRFNGENDSYVETSNNDVEDMLADAREKYERRQAAKESDISSSYMPRSTFKQEAIGNATNDNIRVRKYTPRKKSVAPKKAQPYKTEGLGMAGSDMGSKKQATYEKEEKRSGIGAALAATGTALGSAAFLKAMRKSEQDRREGDLERAARERQGRAKSGTSLRMPGSRMDKNDPYSMTLGSDLDPKSMMRNRLSGDIDYKKGGKVSSASSRADGIAQRGKTRGKLR